MPLIYSKSELQFLKIDYAYFVPVLFILISILLIYTYNVIVISSLLYLALIPLSIFHFQNLNKKFVNENIDNEEHEDIL